VIGAIVVALGTSLPELVTVILARLRGHDDVGVGTLMGSNIFNGLAIVGMAGSIHPIVTPLASVAPTLVVGSLALLMLKPRDGGLIPPSRGLMLLGLYVSALLAMLGSLGRMP
jgi:cation:H+ antiporter